MTSTALSTPPATDLPFLLAEVEVVGLERPSPSFVRLELGSPALADLGLDGPVLDQRVKLVVPHGDGPLPSVAGADASWTSAWLERPVEERGHMRTYTVREVRGTGEATRLVVDVVLHSGDGPEGPGAAWAARADVGSRAVLLAPRRGHEFGGVEFLPGTASELLLVGDETALPAIAGILRDLPRGARGAAFVEVPLSADVVDLPRPGGVTLTWLPRDGEPRGRALHEAVLDHLGAPAATVAPVVEAGVEEGLDVDLWETPTYSSSGEPVDEVVSVVGHDLAGLYAWIAGESAVVTGLRRALVRDLGVDRRQVAFMGYWRLGVAMRS